MSDGPVSRLLQDFWNVIIADPRGEDMDKGNGKLIFDSVSCKKKRGKGE